MKTEQPREGERKKERERKAPLIRLELIAEPTGKRHMAQYLTSRIGMRDMVIDPLQSHIGGVHPGRDFTQGGEHTFHLLLISGNAAVN